MQKHNELNKELDGEEYGSDNYNKILGEMHHFHGLAQDHTGKAEEIRKAYGNIPNPFNKHASEAWLKRGVHANESSQDFHQGLLHYSQAGGRVLGAPVGAAGAAVGGILGGFKPVFDATKRAIYEADQIAVEGVGAVGDIYHAGRDAVRGGGAPSLPGSTR